MNTDVSPKKKILSCPVSSLSAISLNPDNRMLVCFYFNFFLVLLISFFFQKYFTVYFSFLNLYSEDRDAGISSGYSSKK